MPEAASGSQRSSHTRREASTTSNGAFWNAIPSGYGSRARPSGALHKRAADDPVGFERVDVRRREAEVTQDLPVVLTEQRSVPLVQPRRAPREPHRERAVAGGPDDRMVHLFEELAGLELGQLGLAVRLHHLADRHTGCPQELDDLVGGPGAAPRFQDRIEALVLLGPPREVGPARII